MLPKELQETFDNFKKAHEIYNGLLAEIEETRSTLENLETNRAKMWGSLPNLKDSFVRPIGEYLVKHYFPERYLDICGPFGLRTEIVVYIIKDPGLKKKNPKAFYEKENLLRLCIIPGNLSKGELSYDTGETENNSQENTVGQLNGFNNKIKKIESIDEIVKFLKKQEKGE